LCNIERIEVIYGPSSVAYGTNAISGIINLVTKNPNDKYLEVSTLAGSFNTVRSILTIVLLINIKNWVFYFLQ